MDSELGAMRFSRRRLRALLCAVLAGAATPVWAQDPVSQHFTIRTLSSSPDTVTAGDALVRIDVPADVPIESVVVTLNGLDVTANFDWDATASTLTGLVGGLDPGKNRLEVRSSAAGRSDRAAHLTVVNFPREGPVFSGERQTPFACEAFILPVIGTTLPKGIEPDCAVPRQIHYFYKATTGTPAPGTANFKPCPECRTNYPEDVAMLTTPTDVTMKYIVRMEVGTANRAVYVIYMLHDPIAEPEPTFHTPPRGWTGRLQYNFGTGCAGGWYRQGFTGPMVAGETPSGAARVVVGLDLRLSAGYAVMSSAIFPTGVCDYSKPGIGQRPPKGTWLSFGPAGHIEEGAEE